MATRGQVNVYQAIADLILKAIIVIAIVICFLIGFGFLIYLNYLNRPWQNMTLLGAVDAMLAWSFPHILRHYFPSRNSNNP